MARAIRDCDASPKRTQGEYPPPPFVGAPNVAQWLLVKGVGTTA